MAEWSPFHYGYIVISIVAVLLNSTVIYLFLTRKYLQNMYSNTFLFSLAISDLCYAAVAMPLLIKCEQIKEPPPVAVCYAYEYIVVFFGYSTVYHILLAIAEKLCAICFTLRHHSTFCRSLAVKLSLSVWFLSILYTHIPMWWDYFFPSKINTERDEAYYKFHFATGFAIPVIISAIMYSTILHKIFKASKKRLTEDTHRNKTRLHAERKAALTFAIMLAAFLFSWSTWFLGRINDTVTSSNNVYRFITICKFLDPVFNPLLYTFLKNDFRRAFFSLVRSKRQNNKLQEMRLTRFNNHASGSKTQEDILPSSPYSVKHKFSTKHNHHDEKPC
jgi:hypothetical protein